MSDRLRDDVLTAVKFRCPEILREWLPGGYVEGHQYKCASISGGKGDSLTVGLKEPWLWKDWARPDEKGGDLISLFAKIFHDGKYGDALRALADKFQIQRPQQKKYRWETVSPVPEDAYTCDDVGTPLVPKLPITEGIDQSWPYLDAEYRLLNFRIRWNARGEDNPKKVRPLSYFRNKETGEHQWRLGDLPVPRPLLGLPELAAGPEKILVVEGPTTLDAARRLLPDWCVITWSGSSTDIENCDWAPVKKLVGARIALWPDHDTAGDRAMARLRRVLDRPTEVVRLDNSWPKGHDLADLEAAGWNTEKTETWIAEHTERVVPEPRRPRPEVDITGKDYYHLMREIYDALDEAGSGLYYHNTEVVHLRRNSYGEKILAIMEPDDLRSWASEHMELVHYNGNGKKHVSMPPDLAHAVIFNAPDHVPRLNRFARHPIATAQGEFIESTGYYPETSCYVEVPPGYEPDLPLEEAAGIIDDLLADMPFETESDKAAAVAFPLTGILREMISGPVPLFRFEAPVPGTGKTLLSRILIEILSPFFGSCPLSESDDEVRKLITTQLLLDAEAIVFDNVKRLESAALKKALTEYVWKDRVLGHNRDVSIPVRCLWAATLNNPQLDREMFRRSVRVRINARVEDPAARDESGFRYKEIIKHVRGNRGILLSAFCSIAKAGVGHHCNDAPHMGSYESFIAAVYPCLEAAGYAGFMKNVKEDLETVSTDRGPMIEFLHAWAQQYGDDSVKVSTLREVAAGIEQLPVKRSDAGKVSAASLGWLLKRNRGVIFDEICIERDGRQRDGEYYRLSGNIQKRQGDMNF